MDGRHEDTVGDGPVTVTGRLWSWFEVLPFHRGMMLLGSVVIVPVLVIGGFFAFGRGDRPASENAAPVPSHRSTTSVPDLPDTTWGAYVPPRRHRPSPQSAAAPRPRGPATPRSRPTGGRPESACPTSLKKWPWAWELCKRRQGDHTGR